MNKKILLAVVGIALLCLNGAAQSRSSYSTKPATSKKTSKLQASANNSNATGSMTALVSAHYNDTDFRTVLKQLFHDVRTNFDIDDTLSGNVTVNIKNKPFSRALDNVLAQIGATWKYASANSKSAAVRAVTGIQIIPVDGQKGNLISGNPDTVYIRQSKTTASAKGGYGNAPVPPGSSFNPGSYDPSYVNGSNPTTIIDNGYGMGYGYGPSYGYGYYGDPYYGNGGFSPFGNPYYYPGFYNGNGFNSPIGSPNAQGPLVNPQGGNMGSGQPGNIGTGQSGNVGTGASPK